MEKTTLICVGCRQAEGHPEGCDLGGYTTREQLASEYEREWIHNRDHLLPRASCEFC